MAQPGTLRSKSTADLTKAFIGRSLSHAQLESLLSGIELPKTPSAERLWVGSIGYENFREVRDFVTHLRRKRVERLVDVRELPISRRPGYAKTALGIALDEQGIEYVHVKELGNPKALRDLYKSGRVDEGREGYSRHLLEERRDQLDLLVALLEEKRSALMCVEDDQAVCHRDVIFRALESELQLTLDISRL